MNTKTGARASARFNAKHLTVCRILVFVLAIAASASHAADATNSTASGLTRYQAQPQGSKVKLEGTSTIHDWTMEGLIIGGFMEVDPKFPESVSDAKAAKPKIEAFIPVRALKSDSKRMDEVMQEHMKAAKYLRIEYRVIELKPKSAAGEFDATGVLTIAGTSRTNIMPVTIERVDGTKLKVKGSTPVKMTDYGVEPPAPSILGMPVIKTGDEVKISFEWLTAPKAP